MRFRTFPTSCALEESGADTVSVGGVVVVRIAIVVAIAETVRAGTCRNSKPAQYFVVVLANAFQQIYFLFN